MKWVIGIAIAVAAIGAIVFLDWKNLEDRLENWAAESIHEALHGSGVSGGSGSGSTGIGAEFARGVGKKVLNKELGIG
jgi:hypothetical protein